MGPTSRPAGCGRARTCTPSACRASRSPPRCTACTRQSLWPNRLTRSAAVARRSPRRSGPVAWCSCVGVGPPGQAKAVRTHAKWHWPAQCGADVGRGEPGRSWRRCGRDGSMSDLVRPIDMTCQCSALPFSTWTGTSPRPRTSERPFSIGGSAGAVGGADAGCSGALAWKRRTPEAAAPASADVGRAGSRRTCRHRGLSVPHLPGPEPHLRRIGLDAQRATRKEARSAAQGSNRGARMDGVGVTKSCAGKGACVGTGTHVRRM